VPGDGWRPVLGCSAFLADMYSRKRTEQSNTFKSRTTTTMTTTAFKIELMPPAIGIKRFTNHNRTPTTIRIATRLIKGMIDSFPSSFADTQPHQLVTLVSMLVREPCENVERRGT